MVAVCDPERLWDSVKRELSGQRAFESLPRQQSSRAAHRDGRDGRGRDGRLDLLKIRTTKHRIGGSFDGEFAEDAVAAIAVSRVDAVSDSQGLQSAVLRAKPRRRCRRALDV